MVTTEWLLAERISGLWVAHGHFYLFPLKAKTGSFMIQTVAKNSRPKRPWDCSIPFVQNISATSPWLQQLPPILTEAKTAGCADGISGQGTRLDLSADIPVLQYFLYY